MVWLARLKWIFFFFLLRHDDLFYGIFVLQDAPAVEYLIQAYPSYVSVDSLPLAKASTEEKVAYISQYICKLVSINIDSAPTSQVELCHSLFSQGLLLVRN